MAHTTALRSELAAINQMTVSRQVRAQDIMALTEEVSSLEETANVFTTTLRDLTAGRDEVNGDLSQINRCLPGAVDLQDATHSGDMLTVRGLADNEDAVFRYAKDLRASGRFALVVITDLYEEERQTGFTLTLTK